MPHSAISLELRPRCQTVHSADSGLTEGGEMTVRSQMIVCVVLMIAAIPLTPGHRLINQTESEIMVDNEFDRNHCGNLTFEYFKV